MQRGALHDAALGVGERMRDDKRACIHGADDGFDLADFEAGDDAVENLLLGAAQTAVAPVYGDSALELAGDPLANRRAVRP